MTLSAQFNTNKTVIIPSLFVLKTNQVGLKVNLDRLKDDSVDVNNISDTKHENGMNSSPRKGKNVFLKKNNYQSSWASQSLQKSVMGRNNSQPVIGKNDFFSTASDGGNMFNKGYQADDGYGYFARRTNDNKFSRKLKGCQKSNKIDPSIRGSENFYDKNKSTSLGLLIIHIRLNRLNIEYLNVFVVEHIAVLLQQRYFK